jgi:hypothetical protein
VAAADEGFLLDHDVWMCVRHHITAIVTGSKASPHYGPRLAGATSGIST